MSSLKICIATTKNGTQCSMKVKNKDFCHHHTPNDLELKNSKGNECSEFLHKLFEGLYDNGIRIHKPTKTKKDYIIDSIKNNYKNHSCSELIGVIKCYELYIFSLIENNTNELVSGLPDWKFDTWKLDIIIFIRNEIFYMIQSS